ncbi:MAG: hypothetical protein CL581_16670 [Alteromonadaceae bacterium]|nr:hypothetical protein [Alteromonadaceae bacterium]
MASPELRCCQHLEISSGTGIRLFKRSTGIRLRSQYREAGYKPKMPPRRGHDGIVCDYPGLRLDTVMLLVSIGFAVRQSAAVQL